MPRFSVDRSLVVIVPTCALLGVGAYLAVWQADGGSVAAHAQTAIALAQAVLFLWQLAMMRTQLRDTEKAANGAIAGATAARNAAEAARDGVRLATVVAEHQLRAYVTVRSTVASAVLPSLGSEEAVAWTVRASIENAGVTPALNLRGHLNFATFDEQLPPDFAFEDNTRPDVPAVMSLAPHDQTALAGVHIPVELARAIQTGAKKAYLWAWLEYTDVLADTPRRRTEFAAQLFVIGDPAVAANQCFDLRTLDRFNKLT